CMAHAELSNRRLPSLPARCAADQPPPDRVAVSLLCSSDSSPPLHRLALRSLANCTQGLQRKSVTIRPQWRDQIPDSELRRKGQRQRKVQDRCFLKLLE